ncbi:MAG: hypothetical protein KDD53_13260, partial [Bdellovibrionales bacterium]|nr:hypothetical protein [Bdellovibrionales bacterium]
ESFRNGKQKPYIEVSFSLTLCNRDKEKSLTAELRVVDALGALVASSEASLSDPDGKYISTMKLTPARPWEHYEELSFEVPVDALVLEEGQHDVYLELAILLPDNRVACGWEDKVRVRVPAPSVISSSQGEASPVSAQMPSGAAKEFLSQHKSKTEEIGIGKQALEVRVSVEENQLQVHYELQPQA